jgi:hypothetical protein
MGSLSIHGKSPHIWGDTPYVGRLPIYGESSTCMGNLPICSKSPHIWEVGGPRHGGSRKAMLQEGWRAAARQGVASGNFRTAMERGNFPHLCMEPCLRICKHSGQQGLNSNNETHHSTKFPQAVGILRRVWFVQWNSSLARRTACKSTLVPPNHPNVPKSACSSAFNLTSAHCGHCNLNLKL